MQKCITRSKWRSTPSGPRRSGGGSSAGAKADKVADLLETLAMLGQARIAGEGKYAA
jgi:hypothetical protein